MANEATASFSSNTYVRAIQFGAGAGSLSASTGVKWDSTNLTYSHSGSWSSWERASISNALDLYESVSQLRFTEAGGATDLTFNTVYDPTTGTIGLGYPPDLTYGAANTGQVYYNTAHSNWWGSGPNTVGGNAFGPLVVHEIGHALGLAHPHDNTYLLPGVSRNATTDTGNYGLNSNIYTVMSYVDVNQSLADGTQISPSSAGTSYGYNGLGAFDIAALQHLYGANTTYASGNDTYTVPTANVSGTGYQTIWDTGGTDTISYSGFSAVNIDLRAATLLRITGPSASDGALAGGGVSKASGVYGGFTIANGVVIENATGGSGDDTLIGNAAANTLDGGAGNDTASFAGAAAAVTASLATGTAIGGSGSDTLSGIENLIGSDHNDVLTGDGNANTLTGGAGNDTLDGGAGDDTLDGGLGGDTASYATAGAAVTVDLGAGTATGGGGSDTLTSIGSVIGSAYDDTLIANSSGLNSFDGGAGTDTVSYAAVSSTTGVNVDLALGVAWGGGDLSGIENLVGSAYGDTLTGDSGANTLTGGAGYDNLEGGAGDDTLEGGDGTDQAWYWTASAAVTVDLAAGTASGGDGSDTLSSIENVYGSAHDDTLTGDAGANTLTGYVGNDTLYGGAGDDTLNGGAGTDTASYAGAGAAVTASLAAGTATGGAGSDTLSSIENLIGSDYNDVLTGDGWANTLTGGAGDDTLDGGSGGRTDTASYAGAGAAVFVSLAAGTATGGAGSDSLFEIENVTGSAHNDSLNGDDGANVLNGGAGNDMVIALAGNDTLNGGAGDDIMDARHGDDTLIGGAGDDQLYGHNGSDTASYEGAAAAVTVDLAAGTATGGAGSDSLFQIENATGSAFDDTLIGNAGANVLTGGGGSDTVSYAAASAAVSVDLGAGTATGGGGADTLSSIENVTGSAFGDSLLGDGGANTLVGAGGNDIMIGFAGNDTLNGGAGDDIMDARHGDDTLIGDAGDDQLYGHNGSDTADYAGAGAAVFINLAAGTATGGAGSDSLFQIENATGSAYNDSLNGDDGANVLIGGGGNDMLIGFAGNDTLNGGAGADIMDARHGDDTLIGGAGDDQLYGHNGSDTASYEGAAAAVTVDLAAGTATGGAGSDALFQIENVIGSAFDDTLIGDAAANTLTGGAGSDTVSYAAASATVSVDLAAGTAAGGAGADTLSGIENVTGSAFGDSLCGDDGANTLVGGGGNDIMIGFAGNDTLNGGAGDDIMDARHGDDTLIGGAGDDQLYGHNGSDTASYVGAGAAVTVDLAAGTATGGAGSDSLFKIENVIGSSYDDTLSGDSGANTLTGGGGNDTLSGGAGNDRFDFNSGDGADTIADFDAGAGDVLDVVDFGIADFAALLALSTDAGANVTISLNASDSVTLLGLNEADLAADDFLFV